MIGDNRAQINRRFDPTVLEVAGGETDYAIDKLALNKLFANKGAEGVQTWIKGAQKALAKLPAPDIEQTGHLTIELVHNALQTTDAMRKLANEAFGDILSQKDLPSPKGPKPHRGAAVVLSIPPLLKGNCLQKIMIKMVTSTPKTSFI